jgi:hypothetical protein
MGIMKGRGLGTGYWMLDAGYSVLDARYGLPALVLW